MLRSLVMALSLAYLAPIFALRIGTAVDLARRCAPSAQLRSATQPVAVEPVKLVRLLNSVYGAEQMLLFRRVDDDGDDDDSKLLPTLLAFDQASAMESELVGDEAGGLFALLAGVDLGLAGKLLARTDFFEAVAGQRLGPFEVAQKAQGARGVADAMTRHLACCGLKARSCTLGTSAEEQERAAVGMRDMGAQTPAAPSSVRLTAALPATLLCEADGGRQVSVPLGGAADAVLLARLSAGTDTGRKLPLLVSSALWDLRAVPPERLPETTVERDCTLEGCPA